MALLAIRQSGLWAAAMILPAAASLLPVSLAAAASLIEFAVPTSGSTPAGITAGPDGNLWFTELNGNKIGRITPAGAISEFPIPTPGSGPFGITAGPDGNLWFTEPLKTCTWGSPASSRR